MYLFFGISSTFNLPAGLWLNAVLSASYSVSKVVELSCEEAAHVSLPNTGTSEDVPPKKELHCFPPNWKYLLIEELLTAATEDIRGM